MFLYPSLVMLILIIESRHFLISQVRSIFFLQLIGHLWRETLRPCKYPAHQNVPIYLAPIDDPCLI